VRLRTLKLVGRWRDLQRLTKFQLDEIRQIIGEEQYAKALAELCRFNEDVVSGWIGR
jgi:GTP1/Obg family GTP-binding protein